MEDLLQDNVKDCIVLLRKAGIKVWMLTGDKMETAHCISISTGLLSSSDKVWQIERILNGAELKTIMKSFKQSAVPDQVRYKY